MASWITHVWLLSPPFIEFPLRKPGPGSECVATARGILERLVEVEVIEIDLELIFKDERQKHSEEPRIIFMTLFDGHKVLDRGLGRQDHGLDVELLN